MIGERIRLARMAMHMSLRGVAKLAGVSAMAISKYERNLLTPGSEVLIRLAQALKVKPEFFFRPLKVELEPPVFRCRQKGLPLKVVKALEGEVHEWVERYLEVELLFDGLRRFQVPAWALKPTSDDAAVVAEKFAARLREEWKLGEGPIESMVQVLEDQGIKVKVGLARKGLPVDAVTYWMDREIASPVIAADDEVPKDRLRFSLAHELGHVILRNFECSDSERVAYRFAGAFLVPASAARFELGEKRKDLDLFELHLLKHKYGLSMQAWIRRSMELEIISEALGNKMLRRFKAKGWRVTEPGDPYQSRSEEPSRMKRLVMRALAEDLISRARAAELLGQPFADFCKKESGYHGKFPVCSRT